MMNFLIYLSLFVLLLSCSCSFSVSVSGSSLIRVRLALTVTPTAHSNLENELLNIADVHNKERYTKHFKPADIAKIVSLPDSEIRAIKNWLVNLGVDANTLQLVNTGDYLQADITNELFQKFWKKEISLHSNVEFVFPIHADSTVNKVSPSVTEKKNSRRKVLTNQQMKAKQAGLIIQNDVDFTRNSNDPHYGTPSNQRLAYNIPASLTGSNVDNIQMVWGTATYGYLPSDLSEYYSIYNISANEINDVFAAGDAGTPGGDNFGEATLDITCISGIATGIASMVYNSNNASDTEWSTPFGTAFLAFVTELASSSVIPNTLSISLGSLSWDACNLLCANVPKYSSGVYTEAQCNTYMISQRQVCMYPDSATVNRIHYEFIKLGSLGVTILAATGDGGSHFSFVFFNNDPMGNVLNTISCDYQLPTFPAESPYVLGVGGSDWSISGYTQPEAWGGSGSGVSWRFPRPNYQAKVVSNYESLQQSSFPASTSFNNSNRMYPDVAALATNVPIVDQGIPQLAGGTSASAPEFAAVISLINDARLNAGLNSLGFVNPRLYDAAATHYSEMFVDMTTGTSNCDANGKCCTAGAGGFPGAVGYDALTGLGQPNFPGLMKYLASD